MANKPSCMHSLRAFCALDGKLNIQMESYSDTQTLWGTTTATAATPGNFGRFLTLSASHHCALVFSLTHFWSCYFIIKQLRFGSLPPCLTHSTIAHWMPTITTTLCLPLIMKMCPVTNNLENFYCPSVFRSIF